MIDGSEVSLKVDNKAAASAILDKWASAILKSINSIGLEKVVGICFAMPGPFDYMNGIALFDHQVDKFENLYGIHIKEELQLRLKLDEKVVFRFMNDASAFAVGEAWLGASSEVQKNISLTLGTGFGSALINDGIPVLSGEGVPTKGCFYHLPFKDSITEEYFCTRWFVKRWKEMTGETVEGVKLLVEKAEADAKAKALFVEFGTNMAMFLAPWLKIFGAEKLLISGNISGAYPLFQTSFLHVLTKEGLKVDIAISELKEKAAMMGCALLADPDYYERIKPVLPEM